MLDVTGSAGTIHRDRAQRIVNRLVSEAAAALTGENLTAKRVDGDWVTHSPMASGGIGEPGRRHTTEF